MRYSILFIVSLVLLSGCATSGEISDSNATLRAKWDLTAGIILKMLDEDNRSEASIAQPKWLETGNFEQPIG